MEFNDIIKGKRQIRENGKDIVLIKNNGIPVYSFAHVVDDTLMGTTVIVRGEDWFQSVASHVELFNAFGFEPIPYIHTPNIMKIEEGRKRKLSKRKDQEADCRFYLEDGYPIVAVKEYLLNIINSDFESWRKENPNLDYTEFPFSVSKVTTSNALFDFAKLNDISKEYIAKLSAEEVYKFVLDGARKYDEEFAQMLINNKEFAINVFNIDRGGEKPRKDIYKWSMVRDYYKYMFEDFSNIELDFRPITSLENELLYKCLHTYVVLFEDGIDKTFWFERMKKLANNFGYCSDNKEYPIVHNDRIRPGAF
jgi:glutamyl-tRNA synthetase